MVSARDIVMAEDVILVPNVLTDTVVTEGTDDHCNVEVRLDSGTLDVSSSSVSSSSSSSVSSTDIDTSNSNDTHDQGMSSEIGEEMTKAQDAMMVSLDTPMVDVEYVSSEGEEVCREIPVDAILEDEDDIYEKSRSVVKNSALMFAIDINDSSGTDKRPRVKCILCGQKMLRNSIRGHIETIHSNGKRKVKCDLCGKEMLNNNLLRHKITHIDGRTKVKCDLCGKEMFNNNLPSHKMTHSKQPKEDQNRDRERFEVCCLRCGKIVEKNSLAAHVRNVHVNTEKIQCNVCGVRVKRKSLKSHQLIHSKNRKVRCDICGSQMLKLSLKKHMTDVHSNDNHVSCQFCGSIMLRSSLMNHVRNNCAAANR